MKTLNDIRKSFLDYFDQQGHSVIHSSSLIPNNDPSLFFTNADGRTELVYGSKPYAVYETAVLKLCPDAKRKSYSKSSSDLFVTFHSLTAKEFSELSGIHRTESETILDELVEKGVLQKTESKNGSLWKLKAGNK